MGRGIGNTGMNNAGMNNAGMNNAGMGFGGMNLNTNIGMGIGPGIGLGMSTPGMGMNANMAMPMLSAPPFTPSSSWNSNPSSHTNSIANPNAELDIILGIGANTVGQQQEQQQQLQQPQQPQQHQQPPAQLNGGIGLANPGQFNGGPLGPVGMHPLGPYALNELANLADWVRGT
jgi:hypothetical protein